MSLKRFQKTVIVSHVNSVRDLGDEIERQVRLHNPDMQLTDVYPMHNNYHLLVFAQTREES